MQPAPAQRPLADIGHAEDFGHVAVTEKPSMPDGPTTTRRRLRFELRRLPEEFGLSQAMVGWVASSAIVGCFLGALIAGFLSDHYGRKKVLMLSAALSILQTSLSRPRQAPTNVQASLVDLPVTPADALRYSVSMMGNSPSSTLGSVKYCFTSWSLKA